MSARTLFLALGWSSLALLPTRASNLPPQMLPVWGGSGGSAFSRDCGTAYVMTGVRYRSGLLIDAIGLLCRPVAANGALGSETSVGTLTGGGGGTSAVTSCPPTTVVMGARIVHGTYINGIAIFCLPWRPVTRSFASGEAEIRKNVGSGAANVGAVERCESDLQPARGIRGRSAGVVDAIGFTCNEP